MTSFTPGATPEIAKASDYLSKGAPAHLMKTPWIGVALGGASARR